jgi:integrase
MPKDASIYPRARSPYFWCSYWCPEKMRRLHKSTGFRLDDPAGHKKALRFAQDKSEESKASRGLSSREAWGAWVEVFLKLRYADGSRTLERYLGAWDWLRTFLVEKKTPTPAGVDYNLVLEFITWRTGQRRNNGKKISRNTALCDVRVWSVVMREAVRRGFCQGNPCDRLGIKRVPTKERPELTRTEIEKIRAAVLAKEGHLPWCERWMTVSFEFALHQSIRLRATAIPMERIDTEKHLLMWQTKSRHGEERFVTKRLHANLIPLVEALRKEGATVTCTIPRMAGKIWWQLRKEIGLSHTTFHSTRVTVVTELARKGVSEQQAMAYVEHSSRIVHRIYQRLVSPDLAGAEAALDFSPLKVTPAPKPEIAKPA